MPPFRPFLFIYEKYLGLDLALFAIFFFCFQNKTESTCESSENIEKKDSENKIEDESPQPDATGQ